MSKEFLDIQVTKECRFALKCVCDMKEHTVVEYIFTEVKQAMLWRISIWFTSYYDGAVNTVFLSNSMFDIANIIGTFFEILFVYFG